MSVARPVWSTTGPASAATKHDLVAGHVGEDLERADDVEHREVRVEGECDLHGASLSGVVGGGGCRDCQAGRTGRVGVAERSDRARAYQLLR